MARKQRKKLGRKESIIHFCIVQLIFFKKGKEAGYFRKGKKNRKMKFNIFKLSKSNKENVKIYIILIVLGLFITLLYRGMLIRYSK